ncbi:MAG: ISNCY family transposase [Candidatus Aminicenantaceae bacterium]
MKLIDGHITEEEARLQIGLKSVRHIRRIKKRVQEEGATGLLHKSIGTTGNRKLSEEKKKKIISLIQEHYADFKPTFASEKLKEYHDISISHESLRQIMIHQGFWKPKTRKGKGKRHVWRKRKDSFGQMQQFDGSYHKWFEDRVQECCLLLAVDDATGKITHAEFALNEGVHAVFSFWLSYFKKHGFPLTIYLDKFSTYKINHPTAVDNSALRTQFQRALQCVGVQDITAHSPQAKGRVERMNATLQDRLIKEMRLKNISSIEEGNAFLSEEYIEIFNTQFSVIPASDTDLHRPLRDEVSRQLSSFFSIQSERKVQNDFTLSFKNQFFQLKETQKTTVYKKALPGG